MQENYKERLIEGMKQSHMTGYIKLLGENSTDAYIFKIYYKYHATADHIDYEEPEYNRPTEFFRSMGKMWSRIRELQKVGYTIDLFLKVRPIDFIYEELSA